MIKSNGTTAIAIATSMKGIVNTQTPRPGRVGSRVGAPTLGGAQLPVEVLLEVLELMCVQGPVIFGVDFFVVDDDFVVDEVVEALVKFT